MHVSFSSRPSTLLSLIAISDCVPVTLFEVQELWLSCAGHDSPAEGCLQPELMPGNPIAPAHKRARSVDTGKATQQQPGPPIKLSKSRSVENFAAIDMWAPSPDATAILRMRSTLVGQNRRVPTQLSERK